MNVARFLLVVFALIASGCKRLEAPESFFPDLQAAVAAGAVERGWIPSFVGPSAREIHERHDLDTNEIWLRYSFDEGRVVYTAGACQSVGVAHVVKPRKGVGQWWPVELTQKAPNEGQQLSFEYYQCTDRGVIAADHQNRIAYYWRGAS